MTEYDYFPPIRFRFSGDVDQAKGRIPQARTLMAQLIRRMEGFGRDTGQWQGQMSDGTQFRVAKMGDVHVADIFGVTPPVEPPVTARGVAYDVRMITPGAPMVANPEIVIPETVIPEIPDAPHTSPRDILMRPHGERFNGDNDYLWVGVEIDLPQLVGDLYAPAFGTATNTATQSYEKMYGGGEALSGTSIDESQSPSGSIIHLPQVNVMLFEPGWNNEQSNATVLQTLSLADAIDLDGSSGRDEYEKSASPLQYAKYKTIADYTYVNEYHEFTGSLGFLGNFLYYKGESVPSGAWEAYPGAYTDCHQSVPSSTAMWNPITIEPSSIYEPSMLAAIPARRMAVTDTSEELMGSAAFEQIFCTTGLGSFTSSPFVRGGPAERAVDAYVMVDALQSTLLKTDFVDSCVIDAATYKFTSANLVTFNEVTTGIVSSKDFVVVVDHSPWLGGEIDRYYANIGGECIQEVNVAERDRQVAAGVANELGKYEIRFSTESSTAAMTADASNLDFTYNKKSTVESGVYELRLAVGGGNSIAAGSPVPCKVFIQLSRTGEVKQYDVIVPALGDTDSSRFNTSAWFISKASTTVSDTWYPGCWLIDIKNQTVIHETNPANLTRDWFTTE